MNLRKIRNLFILIALIYLAGGVVLYALQDRILFHPVSLKKDHQYDFEFRHKDINIPINEESNLNIVQFLAQDSIPRGVVLYFHGNKKNISWYAKFTPYFTRHGFEVWMIDYPGFGKSTGKFTEDNLYKWALHLYDFARSRFSPDSILIYGKSMGTGIATELASKRDCRNLLLETPYYDFPSVVQHYLPIYPVRTFLHYGLPLNEYLAKVEAPVTILHGTNDHVIKYKNAKKLLPILKKNDEFVTIEGGHHNDLFEYERTIQKLDSILAK